MEEETGLPFGWSVIESALKNGILLEKNGEFVHNPGYISLMWHPGLRRYCFAYGTDAKDAGMVLLEDFSKTWVTA